MKKGIRPVAWKSPHTFDLTYTSEEGSVTVQIPGFSKREVGRAAITWIQGFLRPPKKPLKSDP